ncbi:DNA cytosine methyltransferase, partial [Microcoleus anatoxicus]|uniref:DNA cytosine methyltransferase n=1 Tax=Microcoleus anatoxicus TaxID=2705319 RepID=UPI0030C928E5
MPLLSIPSFSPERSRRAFFLLPSSFFLLPSSFFLLPSSFFLLPSSFFYKMRTVDLFAGCGGLSLGFQNAGFNVVAAFDYWLPAIQVY